MSRRWPVAAVVLAALLVAVTPTPASAHAVLESTTPGDRSRVATSPSEVTLQFSEDITAPPGSVRVVGASGQRVDSGSTSVDGPRLRVPVDAELADGAYVVSWRVISADSHPVRGAFTFTVGEGPSASDSLVARYFDQGSDRWLQVAGAVARAAGYLGTLLAAGAALYLAIVFEGAVVARSVRRLLLGSAVVGALGVIAQVVIDADLATGLGLGAIGHSNVRADVLGSGVGLSMAITLAGLIVLAGLVALAVMRRVLARSRRVLLVAGALVAVGGFAAAGHSTQGSVRWLTSIADVVHVAFGAAWFGGLVMLGVALRHRAGGDPVAGARAVARFSSLATVSVLAVGGAGLTLGWAEVRSVDALTTTAYGRLLMVKVAMVAGIAAVGAYNHFVVVPAAVAGEQRVAAWAKLRRTVATETAAMVLVIGLTSVLVNVTPAFAVAGRPFAETAPLGTGTAQLVVDPARTGPTSLHLYVLDATGRTVDLAPRAVTFELSLPSARIGPIDRIPLKAGPGHFQLDGDDFAIAGRWQVTVVVEVSRFEDQTATFTVRIRP